MTFGKPIIYIYVGPFQKELVRLPKEFNCVKFQCMDFVIPTGELFDGIGHGIQNEALSGFFEY